MVAGCDESRILSPAMPIFRTFNTYNTLPHDDIYNSYHSTHILHSRPTTSKTKLSKIIQADINFKMALLSKFSGAHNVSDLNVIDLVTISGVLVSLILTLRFTQVLPRTN